MPLRVLFCIGINQNFFDLPADGLTTGAVWQAFVSMMDQLKTLPGITFIGDFDDDSHQVGRGKVVDGLGGEISGHVAISPRTRAG